MARTRRMGKTKHHDQATNISDSIPAVADKWAVIEAIFGDAYAGGTPVLTVVEGSTARFKSSFSTSSNKLNVAMRIKADKPGTALGYSTTGISANTTLTIEYGYDDVAE